jgi:putative endonuclease
MKQNSYVYILTNKRNGTLYTGSTTDLLKRIHEHKNKEIEGFSKKYNLNTLVFYEIHSSLESSSQRERSIKNWKRKWKLNLIEKTNPEWKDLSYEL